MYRREHAKREGTEAAKRAQVHVENIANTSNYIPLPEAMNFLKKVYMVMLYRACQYINNYLRTACQKHLPPHDTHHVTVAEGCKVTERGLVGDYILFAREMCFDELIKKMFLACWKNLDLPMVNVDSLLHDIHLLWDDMETNDIVELQAKKLDNVESKKDPHVMLIDDILLEKKFRDTVLVFMNGKTKCKEVNGSHTIIKKRCQKI